MEIQRRGQCGKDRAIVLEERKEVADLVGATETNRELSE